MITSSTLSSSSTYTMKIKPHTGVDPEGLLFPTQAGTYKVDVSFDYDQSGNFDIHDHLYLEVSGINRRCFVSKPCSPLEVSLVFDLMP